MCGADSEKTENQLSTISMCIYAFFIKRSIPVISISRERDSHSAGKTAEQDAE